MSRKTSNDIFVDYVSAYLTTISTGEYIRPTIFFVMSRVKKDAPKAVVVEMVNFDESTLAEAATKAAMESSDTTLDLIMYCNFEGGYKTKDAFGLTFACRDGYGNTLHQMYQYNRKNKKFTERPIIPGHNKWIPPTGKHERIRDAVLTKVATYYAMSMTGVTVEKKKSLHKKL